MNWSTTDFNHTSFTNKYAIEKYPLWTIETSKTIGQLASDAFQGVGTGTIMGVFHHGWYLSAHSAVWMLHNSMAGEIPFGIGIEKFDDKIPYLKEMDGEVFFWRENKLVFPCIEMVISLHTAGTHNITPKPSMQKLETTRTCIKELLLNAGRGYLKNLLEVECTGADKALEKNNVIDRYEVKSQEKIHSFLNALYAYDKEKLKGSVQAMIGFGQGLTPSLDDWLCGFIYTIQRMRIDETMQGQVHALCQYIAEIAPERTNRISATYLLSIAQGSYFELLEKAIFSTSKEDMRPLLSIGSSSGSDMLTGIAFAISYAKNMQI